MDGLRALIRHLRSSDGHHDPDRLASEFGLSRDEVIAVIAHARTAVHEERRQHLETSVRSSLVTWCKNIWDWCTRHPIGYIFVTATVVNTSLIIWVSLTLDMPGHEMILLAALLFLLVPVLHSALAYRRGAWKLGFYSAGAIIFSWFLLPLLLTVVALRMSGEANLAELQPRNADDVLFLLAPFFAGAVGFVATAVAGLAGTYQQSLRRATEKDLLPRGELVRRLLEARELLRARDSVPQPQANAPLRKRAWHFAIAALAAVASQALLARLTHRSYNLAVSKAGTLPYEGIGAGLVLVLIDFCVLSMLGFHSRSLRWSAALGTIYFVAMNLTVLFQLGRGSVEGESAMLSLAGPGVLAANVGFAAIGAATAKARLWATRQALLRARDENTLRAEVIDLEWRLAPKHQTEALMAVDVKGSTELKRDADPIVAEDCFRQYQAMVRRVCLIHRGNIHATAGDGAIVGFERPMDALDAAVSILAELPEFNHKVNRLASEFRLRIGLHLDEVYGDLSEVQFTRAIDVTSHIEGLAPTNGIAVTDNFALALPDLTFTDLDQMVDGHSVFAPNLDGVGAPQPGIQE